MIVLVKEYDWLQILDSDVSIHFIMKCQFVFEAAVATFVKLQKHSNASQSPVNYLVSLRSLSEDRHPDILMLHY